MEEEFKKFVLSYDMDDENIRRKYEHSLRVEKVCINLGKSLNFSAHDLEVCRVIGLLHDYGRFDQWSKYKTFRDSISIDHGDHAVYKLFDQGDISNYYSNKEDYDIIYDAIKYHNKYSVPSDVKDMTFCNIARDGDKLDLLYMYTTGEFVIHEEPEISEAVKEQFFNHELIDHKNNRTTADHSINSLSLIFDLNFDYSYRYLKEENIMGKAFDLVKNKEKFKPYFDEVEKYIDDKIREDDKDAR